MKTLVMMALFSGAGVPVSGFTVDASNVVIRVERISITRRPILLEAASPAGPWHRAQAQGWTYDLFSWDWTIVFGRSAETRFFKVVSEANKTEEVIK